MIPSGYEKEAFIVNALKGTANFLNKTPQERLNTIAGATGNIALKAGKIGLNTALGTAKTGLKVGSFLAKRPSLAFAGLSGISSILNTGKKINKYEHIITGR